MIKFDDLIVHESDGFIIINKPSGLSSTHDRSGSASVESMAEKVGGLMVIHRLDKFTSGALVLAKNETFYRHFSILLENRKVEKIYHAVVDGIASFKNYTVNKPILPKSERVIIDKKGKEAITVFDTLEVYKYHTLLECKPLTGRMHQIRIHLAEEGYPIAGDTLYNGKQVFLSSIKKKFNLKKYTEEKPLISRFALHAKGLVFNDENGKKVDVTVPYPKDMRALINQLSKNV